MKWRKVREVLLFFIGALGFAHEVLFTQSERSTLIIAFLSMMGLPIVSSLDRYRSECRNCDDSDNTKD